MDLLSGLTQGFAILFAPHRLAACAIGLAFGIAGGLIPGIGPLGAIVLALTLLGAVAKAFGPLSPLIFVVAFAYGTLQGRALAALAAGAAMSPGPATRQPTGATLLAGAGIGVIAAMAAGAMAVFARLHLAAVLGPAEYAAAIAFLLLAGAGFSASSAARALASAVLGLLLALVGDETETGIPRLTFGLPQLEDGVSVFEVAIGLFVIASLFGDLGGVAAARSRSASATHPAPSLLRGTILGVAAALLPTNSAVAASTVAARQAQPSADPFDPASRADAPGIFAAALASDVRFSLSLIPLLAWSVPCDAVSALLWKVFALEQAVAGEGGFAQTGMLWLVCATLIVVRVAPPAVFRLPQKALARLGRLDVRIAAPLIVAACCVAILSITRDPNDFLAIRNPADLVVMFAFGLIGYGMILADLDRGLMLLAFVLGSRLEENISRTLLIWRGDATVFFQRPIPAALLAAGVALLVGARVWRHRRHNGRARSPVAAAGTAPP